MHTDCTVLGISQFLFCYSPLYIFISVTADPGKCFAKVSNILRGLS